jgi:hypothetical protein
MERFFVIAVAVSGSVVCVYVRVRVRVCACVHVCVCVVALLRGLLLLPRHHLLLHHPCILPLSLSLSRSLARLLSLALSLSLPFPPSQAHAYRLGWNPSISRYSRHLFLYLMSTMYIYIYSQYIYIYIYSQYIYTHNIYIYIYTHKHTHRLHSVSDEHKRRNIRLQVWWLDTACISIQSYVIVL